MRGILFWFALRRRWFAYKSHNFARYWSGFWRAYWMEVAQTLGILVGWCLVLLGIAHLTGRPDVVWPLGIGILVLGLVGYRFILDIFVSGLYVKATTPDVDSRPQTE